MVLQLGAGRLLLLFAGLTVFEVEEGKEEILCREEEDPEETEMSDPLTMPLAPPLAAAAPLDATPLLEDKPAGRISRQKMKKTNRLKKDW
jgi:small neutral amino acid transporter SnatA (MarC family)